MNESAKTILLILGQYLEKYPDIRFGQALSNLNINEFANKTYPEASGYLLRDIYNDSDDKILGRMKDDADLIPEKKSEYGAGL
jgi:hypothetical protein